MTQVYGLVPRVEHYSCMVDDLLGRAGELDKTDNFINKIPIKPNILIWITFLGACCRGNGRQTELEQGRTPELSQEKLAVAFVLTRNSGLPIRIMKNLRVHVIQTGFLTLRMENVHVRITGDWPASLVSRNIGIVDR
ncbi:hypothetical protein NC651_030746 [Populus alba x Populus x berolinensis]|nr:hypothetical protein NC651_030746 [Populus alba x Populus x berolinensis]